MARGGNKLTLECKNYRFTRHAVFKMFERNIAKDQAKTAVQKGEVIQTYPDDRPYPSKLMLYFIDNRPLHVVVAFDSDSGNCIIITVYEPSPKLWKKDYKTRK